MGIDGALVPGDDGPDPVPDLLAMDRIGVHDPPSGSPPSANDHCGIRVIHAAMVGGLQVSGPRCCEMLR